MGITKLHHVRGTAGCEIGKWNRSSHTKATFCQIILVLFLFGHFRWKDIPTMRSAQDSHAAGWRHLVVETLEHGSKMWSYCSSVGMT